MKLAVPDLISPSCFPALATVELGFFARERLDITHDLRASTTSGAPHDAPAAAPFPLHDPPPTDTAR